MTVALVVNFSGVFSVFVIYLSLSTCSELIHSYTVYFVEALIVHLQHFTYGIKTWVESEFVFCVIRRKWNAVHSVAAFKTLHSVRSNTTRESPSFWCHFSY